MPQDDAGELIEVTIGTDWSADGGPSATLTVGTTDPAGRPLPGRTARVPRALVAEYRISLAARRSHPARWQRAEWRVRLTGTGGQDLTDYRPPWLDDDGAEHWLTTAVSDTLDSHRGTDPE